VRTDELSDGFFALSFLQHAASATLLSALRSLSYFRLTSPCECDFVVSSQKLTIKLSTKGQVILPKSIRQRRHWVAGTRLVVEDTVDGVLLKVAPSFEPTRSDEVFGSLKVSGPPKTLEEMDSGVLAEARRRHAGD
jgi:AbrB family looped-hinge helix DNA binding protein